MLLLLLLVVLLLLPLLVPYCLYGVRLDGTGLSQPEYIVDSRLVHIC